MGTFPTFLRAGVRKPDLGIPHQAHLIQEASDMKKHKQCRLLAGQGGGTKAATADLL